MGYVAQRTVLERKNKTTLPASGRPSVTFYLLWGMVTEMHAPLMLKPLLISMVQYKFAQVRFGHTRLVVMAQSHIPRLGYEVGCVPDELADWLLLFLLPCCPAPMVTVLHSLHFWLAGRPRPTSAVGSSRSRQDDLD